MSETELILKAISETKDFCKKRNLDFDYTDERFTLIAGAFYEYFKKNQKV